MEVEDLPDDYLGWLHGLDDLSDALRRAVDREWSLRFEPPGEPEPARAKVPPDVRVMAEELVRSGYRELAKRHHPDQGGATRAMQLVNAAAEWLRAQLRATA